MQASKHEDTKTFIQQLNDLSQKEHKLSFHSYNPKGDEKLAYGYL